MKHVHLIDTSIASDNLGDEIIVEECRSHLLPLFPDAYISTSSGHDGLGPWGRDLAGQADVVFLLGTNALSARDQTKRRFVWTVTKDDIPVLKNKVVLFGVGANRDFDKVDRTQAKLLSTLLSSSHGHAVRDSLGGQIIRTAGRKAINTTCPTLWRYIDKSPPVPSEPAPSVCFTLTKHKANSNDAAMIEILRNSYENLAFWPQQPRDLPYLQELTRTSDIEILPPSLQAYDAHLAKTDTDVTGTRLHGCIRGLKHNRRVLVVSIDNRAREIGSETGLPTIAREDIPANLAERIKGPIPLSMTLPRAAKEDFLGQFR
ncbi:polysaccharide pyruvyl transferase family protein [Aestuariibius insulae]|uniref:polysaccharide pyruvyl transferase family protein n=1 Tax=Aestuariibius insulae TaxID=2058287 RepID=UPI00345EFBFD